jgi:hypothetical protein
MKPPRILITLCLLISGFLAFADVPTKENILTSDLLKIKQLRSVKISPDGARAVYVVRSIDEKKDKKEE